MRNLFLAASLLIATNLGHAADFTPPSSTQLDPKIEKRIDGLLARLTLEEKVGLLCGTDYMSSPSAIPAGTSSAQSKSAADRVHDQGST